MNIARSFLTGLLRTAGLALVAALAIGPADIGHAREPAPFRLDDERTGRPYSYGNREYIHRQTFRFRSQEQRRWEANPSGFRTTFGSRRSKEFFAIADFRNVWDLEPWLDVDARFSRAEDFDGRYDRFLTGIGIRPSETVRIAALGDIVAEKCDIDMHLETVWTINTRHRVRLTAVAVDAMYLSKAYEGYYHTTPYTFFGQYTGRPWNRMVLNLWGNVNPNLSYEHFDDATLFGYRQTDAGLAVTFPVGHDWSATFDGKLTQSDRSWESLENGGERGTLSRQFHEIGAELWREPKDALSGWLGMRHISLDETLSGLAPGHADVRIETMVHGGVLLPLPRWRAVFWPGLYFSFLEKNERSGQGDPDRSEPSSGTGVLKAAFPVEFAFAQGKTLTLNVTFVSDDRTGFGGGNIQGVFPF